MPIKIKVWKWKEVTQNNAKMTEICIDSIVLKLAELNIAMPVKLTIIRHGKAGGNTSSYAGLQSIFDPQSWLP